MSTPRHVIVCEVDITTPPQRASISGLPEPATMTIKCNISSPEYFTRLQAVNSIVNVVDEALNEALERAIPWEDGGEIE